MDKEWGITICDPDMLLGVERKLTVEDGIRFLELPNYIKDTHEEWTAKLKEINRPVKSATPSVPFPEGKQFSSNNVLQHKRGNVPQSKLKLILLAYER